MKNLKEIIRNFMNWINLSRIGLFMLGTLLLYLSWKYKSFATLLLAAVILITFSTLLFSKYKNMLIPVIATLIMLFIAEISLPYVVTGMQSSVKTVSETSYEPGGYFERILGFGYRPKPGVHKVKLATTKGNIIYDVVYTIGDDGYRLDVNGKDFGVFIYGGSFTFGEGLNDNQTISYYLFHNYGIKTKNIASHGYGLHQALFNIEQGLTSKKRGGVNVLITAPWHSLRSSCKPYYTYGTPRYEITIEGAQLKGVCEKSFIKRILLTSNIANLITALLTDENIITDNDMDLYIAIIRQIARLSDENNANLIIGYIDATEEELSRTKWTNEKIIAELSKIAKVVDITLAERREDLDKKYYIHEFDKHPTAIANQKRAEILYPLIFAKSNDRP